MSALSFSSWFCVPDQGMIDFEILNRASAFLVRASGTGSRSAKVSFREFSQRAPFPAPKVHLVTASHVVAPWRWPKYYPEEWLQQVCEKHALYTAELRHADGTFATQSELKPISYHHATRDLAALHFENEDEVLELLDEVGVDVLQLLPAHLHLPQVGQQLEFHGHEVRSQGPPSGQDADSRTSVPSICRGVLQGRTARQVFARTVPVLEQGMCGGPVLMRAAAQAAAAAGGEPTDGSSISGSDARGGGEQVYCTGVLEGIVPRDHSEAELQALAIFVESHEIRAFLQDIEEGAVVPLIGGHAIAAINADKDEAKMDFERIISGDAGPSSEPSRNFGGSNFPTSGRPRAP